MLGSRDDRLHYSSPSCDVHRADVVGIVGEPARCTDELGLTLAVGLVDVAARRASARGVARVYGLQGNAREGGLVAEERAQLKERPSRMHRPLASPDRCPFADSRQVFDGDTASGVFGLGDDVLRDHVVDVLAEAGLLAREWAKGSLGRLGAGGLQTVAKTLVSLARRLDGRAAGVVQ